MEWPQSIEAIHSDSSGFSEERKNRIESQLSKLQEINDPFNTGSELAAQTAGLNHLYDGLIALQFSAWQAAFTPYQFGVGAFGTLSPDNAKEFAAQKLTDQYNRINGSNGLALWVGAETTSDLANILETITSLLNYPDWISAAAQARHAATREFSELQTAVPAQYPYWKNDDFGLGGPSGMATNAVLEQVVFIESVDDENNTAIDELELLAAKAGERIEQVETAIQSVIELFQGGVGAVQLQGQPEDMTEQIRRADLAYFPYSTMLLLVSESDMKFMYEMVGL